MAKKPPKKNSPPKGDEVQSEGGVGLDPVQAEDSSEVIDAVDARVIDAIQDANGEDTQEPEAIKTGEILPPAEPMAWGVGDAVEEVVRETLRLEAGEVGRRGIPVGALSKIRGRKPELERIMRGVVKIPPGLSTLNEDGSVTTKRGKRENIEIYDFRRPYRVSRDRMRTLEALYDRLVKMLEGWLVGRLRTQVEIAVEEVSQVSYGEFTNSLENPCAAFIFDVHGSGGQHGVINIEMGLAYHIVDRLFGGDGRTVDMRRPLTKVERMAIRPLAERVGGALTDIWQGLVTLDVDIREFQSMPDMLKTSARDESVLLATLTVSAAIRGRGDTPTVVDDPRATGRIQVVLPFAVLDQFLMNSNKRNVRDMPGTEEELARARLVAEGGLRVSRTVVAARLPEFSMTLEELAYLRVGDVVPTGISVETPLRVLVGEAERYLAVPGKVGRRMAARITAQVAEEVHWAGREAIEAIDNEVTWLS